MKRKLVFATNNKHKLSEIHDIIGETFEILSLEEIGCFADIPENEPTLEGNALAKARYVYDRYKLDCFADDTGLEIYSLELQPGVKSARYAGNDCNPENNISKVINELHGTDDRRARFRTVICLIMKGEEFFFEGSVEGNILTVKKGNEGFGYDPIFKPEGYDISFAEMAAEEKNRISHRGRAMQKLINYLMHPQSHK